MGWIEILFFIIGGIALIAFFILFYLYMKTGKRFKTQHNVDEEKLEKDTEYQSSYTVNERLDGAHVSHRRTHPDRVKEEQERKEMNGLDHMVSYTAHNQLFMVYSPCNADLLSANEQEGIIFRPHDAILYAPVSGRVSYHQEQKRVVVVSDHQIAVVLSAYHNETMEALDLFPIQNNHKVIKASEAFYKLSAEAPDFDIHKVNIRLTLENVKEGQLVLLKKTRYVLKGDKIITIRIS